MKRERSATKSIILFCVSFLESTCFSARLACLLPFPYILEAVNNGDVI